MPRKKTRREKHGSKDPPLHGAELAGGEVFQGAKTSVVQDYPHLTTEDIRAAVAYGAASVALDSGTM